VHFTDFFGSRKPKNNRLNCFGRICLFWPNGWKVLFLIMCKEMAHMCRYGRGWKHRICYGYELVIRFICFSGCDLILVHIPLK